MKGEQFRQFQLNLPAFKGPMAKTLAIIDAENRCSTTNGTPYTDYLAPYFRKEIKELLKSVGAGNVEIHKGYAELTGFFTMPSGKMWYFSTTDLRGGRYLLIRTAKSYKDYTGGINQQIKYEVIPKEFLRQFKQIVGVD
jgi:hypothetical protein